MEQEIVGHQIEGLKSSDGNWYPLYYYKNRSHARGALGWIIGADEEQLPKELQPYEDFRYKEVSSCLHLKAKKKHKVTKEEIANMSFSERKAYRKKIKLKKLRKKMTEL